MEATIHQKLTGENMGLDLALLPIEHDNGKSAFSHTVLNCERRQELFDAIMELRSHPVPEDFATYLSRDDKYEESHYGNTQETPYGEPVEWVYAKDLTSLSDHAGIQDNEQNRAVWAYLAQLPPKFKVALYWS